MTLEANNCLCIQEATIHYIRTQINTYKVPIDAHEVENLLSIHKSIRKICKDDGFEDVQSIYKTLFEPEMIRLLEDICIIKKLYQTSFFNVRGPVMRTHANSLIFTAREMYIMMHNTCCVNVYDTAFKIYEEMIEHCKNKDQSKFYELWSEYVPSFLRFFETDEYAKKYRADVALQLMTFVRESFKIHAITDDENKKIWAVCRSVCKLASDSNYTAAYEQYKNEFIPLFVNAYSKMCVKMNTP